MAMRHGGGEERSNVSRSAVESGEAARDEAPSAVAGGCLSPRWKCVRFHGSECSAETGADERPLIAISAGNFNTAKHFIGYPFGTSKRKISTIFYNTAKFVVSIEFF